MKPIKGLEFLDTLPKEKQAEFETQLLGAVNCLKNIYHAFTEEERGKVGTIFESLGTRLVTKSIKDYALGNDVDILPTIKEACMTSAFLNALIARFS